MTFPLPSLISRWLKARAPAAPRLPHFRSLVLKLGALLAALAAVVIGTIYVAVVPRLETRLAAQKLDGLQKESVELARVIRTGNALALNDQVESVGSRLNARIVMFEKLNASLLLPIADSRRSGSTADVQSDPVARQASEARTTARGRTERGGTEFAEVATPIGDKYVLLISAPLDDVVANVSYIRRRLLIVGALALIAFSAIGLLVSVKLTGRLRHLQSMANQIAAGDLQTPVSDIGRDEVGELARTFERMRRSVAQLDRARREFIANASHELRTPIFALGGFLELLADKDLGEGTRQEFIEEMQNQVDRLTKLAADLLDWTRIEAGQLRVACEPVDLQAVARKLVDEWAATAKATGHSLRSSGSSAVALADEARVLQVGRAFVENAIRHTPEGTRIEVRVRAYDGRSCLAVYDDGPGVPAADRESVFEPFYRGGGAAAFGSGIGLSIARDLAQLMNGSIELQSTNGNTEFSLVVPANAESVSTRLTTERVRSVMGTGK